jgi:HD-GYP domain-containing protein (c-di-GMP phosphodiesterase class II)
VQQVFTRWDGRGVPGDIGGEEIALPMRLFHVAESVEVFHRTRGSDAAVDVARARRGKQFDPGVVDAFCSVATDVLGDPSMEPDWHALIAEEPALQRRLTEVELDAALEAVADFTDLRSPSRAGHSRGVADLSARAGAHAGLPEADITTVRRAALLHDIGCTASPRRSSTSGARCRHRSSSGCACTPTTPSGCWPVRRLWRGSVPSPR